MLRTCFTEDQQIFREAYRRFLEQEVLPHREEWRKAGIVPREKFLQMGQQGYLLTWADEDFGGLGVEDFRYQQIMIEEDGQLGEPGFFHTLHSRLVAPYLKHFGTPEQQAKYIPGCVSGECIMAIAMTEPDAGSDLAGMKTRAEDKGDHWLLNGSKVYISNGILADLVIVAAKTNPEKPREMTLFLVERGMEGFERGRNLDKLGLKAQDTAELFFNDVKVPKANVLGEVGRGMQQLMQGLAEERLITACISLAAANAAFDLTKTYVEERKAFGGPLSQQQNTRFTMANMRTEIDVAQAFVDQCVAQHNDGKLTSVAASQAKYYCSEVEGRMVDLGVQLHGGAGYMQEYEICNLYANARISRILAGTSEIMKEIIARSFFTAK
ncbi:acyl-CoA dehydrogenase family protein [Spongiibacter taiwanensis]|uniref:acyl-CoA dehydrogenase family protein n=1 Tax=Spongiibacter taiwanensis TaxID=1748242 RepID=UPI002034E087|nr:acyl-CoA dehydrogenase family protein [Spongiibacter taiwanensis]USA44031.1 acyl-CoA dehydrogenase family protein [Spongiibacter taiwanensis]